MKLKDITHWSERWSTRSVLWTLIQQWTRVCLLIYLYGEHQSSGSRCNAQTEHIWVDPVPRNVYDHVLEFLKRKLREVMDAEIDISDVVQ